MSEPSNPAGSEAGGAYRVLARKYRPQTFDDLIGQEPMVQTISNSFKTGRVPQAWMLTGVRGVGKTTTARILARALNYELPGKVERPTIDLGEPGVHCEAIMASRHVDVIEMDAASHTGIDDIRDITDASRYMPASARYKVYIIDEVHMLSRQAFNGLLKTLEEPPAHVKFIFATTEIRKVPVTVLSRCQRFDLRRIDRPVLVDNLAGIAAKEGVEAEPEALSLIAEAAEGSVRDAQSLLDQAIAHGAGEVRAKAVSGMLGLADRGRIVDLFETVMSGRIGDALQHLSALYQDGADPVVILGDLAGLTHRLTQAQLIKDGLHHAGLESGMRERLESLADRLAIPHLSRAWQILLKGLHEVETAPRPIAAADMVLVRLAYAADLPAPETVLKQLRGGTGTPAPHASPTTEGRRQPAKEASSSRARLAPPPVDLERNDASAGNENRTASKKGAPATMHDLSLAVQETDHAPKPAPETHRLRPDVGGQPAQPATFDALVELARDKRDIRMLTWLERSVRLVSFEAGRVTLAPVDGSSPELATALAQKLKDWTGTRWMVALAREGGDATIHEKRQENRRRLIEEAESAPEIVALMALFPDAEITKVDVLEHEDEGREDRPAAKE